MKTNSLLLFLFLSAISNVGRSQNAKDFLCLDPKKELVFTDKRGNTEGMLFVKTFVHEGHDTIYLYKRTQLTGEYIGGIDTLVVKVNGNVLTLAGYGWDGTRTIYEKDRDELVITIVKPGEEKMENTYVTSTPFEVTTTYLSKYKLPNGVSFKKVIKFDMYDKQADFHYITYIAKGEGVVDQGTGEHRRIKKQ